MLKHAQVIQSHVLLALGTLLLFSLVSCSNPLTNKSDQSTSHAIYSYEDFVTPATNNLYPGDHISLTWKPMLVPTVSEAAPTRQTINAELYSPLPTHTNLSQNRDQDSCSSIAGNVVAQIMPIQTDDWMNKTYTSALPIPYGLAAGDYVLIQKVSFSGNGNGGCSFIESRVEIKAK